ncbi:MAG: hypothetical protein LBP40_06415 [Campylobacteraceae bacterium]|jgi:hypothetical protein|nr:hypothetical protein [Campylobacteraceae bacterium]
MSALLVIVVTMAHSVLGAFKTILTLIHKTKINLAQKGNVHEGDIKTSKKGVV